MLSNKLAYTAKPTDASGQVHYTDEEHAVWHDLITAQQQILPGRACDAYLQGMAHLNLPHDRIPQCSEVSVKLREITGWQLEPVPALISFDRFFELLATRRFPAATFIRHREELHYLQEPDIFHEIIGHCPLLTNAAYAEFAYTYGKLGLTASHADRVMLARLYWFTIEFGLLQTSAGLRAYGGGILSSLQETHYSLESTTPKRLPFDVETVLRTPYRIDTLQNHYFVLNDFDTLYQIVELDLLGLIHSLRNEHQGANHE